MTNLSSLPPEILREILQYLPVRTLLSFGLTSKHNHAISLISLSSLRLGVFPSRLSSTIALLEAGEDRSSVQIILPKSECRTKEMVIRNQNLLLFKAVSKYQYTLRILEVALWDLQHQLSESIGRMHNLRHLSIRLDHPHTRPSDVNRLFWRTAPGSTVWNALYPGKNGGRFLGRLESLNLERVGITDYQLQRILEENPKICELRLRKCLMLTREIFAFLARSESGRRLKVFCFTQSTSTEIDNRVLKHIDYMTNLEVSNWLASWYSSVRLTTVADAVTTRLP